MNNEVKDELTTKLFLRIADSMKKVTRTAGQISGYMNVNGVDPLNVPWRTSYTIQTVQEVRNVQAKILGVWAPSYKGRVQSFIMQYVGQRDGVQVKFGHIQLEKYIPATEDKKANTTWENVACWVAAYDDNLMTFEIHLKSGAIYQSTQAKTGITKDAEQIEYESTKARQVNDVNGIGIIESPELGTKKHTHVHPELLEKFKRTGHKKLCVIIECLQQGMSGPKTVEISGVSLSVVNKVKAELRIMGKL
ncbi:hypothetical protein [Aeromonas caviae]|uniref:hypothetical protein n=1 Tax=Aeromonas caviae TaxID=648 RepID=UPI002256CCA3|nr:hypothetical protein [Aeromonas caviae]MCX4071924.1 hypothetical protein [Aeromonas caviae]